MRWLRQQPDRQQLVFDSYYDDPLLAAAQRYHASEEWQAVRGWLPVPGQGPALDVGAGRGIASYALARDGYAVTALEPDPSSLVGAGAIRGLASEAGLVIEVREDFSEQLPFPDRSFSIVFARAVLHHTRDLSSACREFFRVLKPGGALVAIREHVISRASDLEAFHRIHPLHRMYGGENAYLLRQYLDAISASGLVVRKVLAPLESEINLAPYTAASFRREIASRVGDRIPGAGAMLGLVLDIPGVWPVARALIGRFDHRPGRLYSFIAERP